MKLNLNKPLAFFDLETTGINTVTDKIIEIAVLKIKPDGSKEWFEQRLNPGIPIPKASSDIHGIFDEDVKDCPSFSDIANKLSLFLEKCDMGGFNSNRFDLPLLMQEFASSKVEFNIDKRNLIDVQRIFHKMEQRNLSAALKFYCKKELINSHSARADTQATFDVFLAQLERYKDEMPRTMEQVHNFCNDNGFYDLSGRMVKDKEAQIRFNFGKHKGLLVTEVLQKEPQYYSWIMKSDFPIDTKNKLTAIRLKSLNTK